MIRREELRLKRAFRSVLLASLAAPAAIYACSTKDSGNGAQDASSGDATTGDASAGDSASDGSLTSDGNARDTGTVESGSDTGIATDAPPVSCTPSYAPADAGPDASPDACNDYLVHLPCGLEKDATPAGCDLYLVDCAKICTQVPGTPPCHVTEQCQDGAVVPDRTGVTIECATCGPAGRRPAGLLAARFECTKSVVGDYFARAAHLEAASVGAFRALREELVAHGAPRSLVKMAERSAADEVRHARVTRRIARRFGATAARARVVRRPVRRLEDVALENAIEGCVRETFGAMVATWQARNAGDSEIRREMASIATDETRHAALAWAVARWTEARLDADGLARIAEAKRASVAALRREQSERPARELIDSAGLPTAAQARAMVDALERAVWT